MPAVSLNYDALNFANGAQNLSSVGPYQITGAPTTTSGDASVTLKFFGDFYPGESSEFINVQIEGFQSADFTGAPGNDDYQGETTVTFTIPQATWASIIADGRIDIVYGFPGGDLDDFTTIFGSEEYINIQFDYVSGRASSPSNPPIVGTAGDDTLRGNDAADRIDGATGNDTIIGNGGDDRLVGGSDDDLIFGNAGADSINGNEGADNINGNQGADLVRGGRGNDIVQGGRDDDQVFGDNGDDFVNGNMGDDSVYGGQGHDEVHGGQGADFVFGDLGNDQIWGDLGNDRLSGGGGADVFHFALNSGYDVIQDFNQAEGDRLDFQGQTFMVSELNGSTIFDLSGGGTLVLQGVSAASLTDFLLV